MFTQRITRRFTKKALISCAMNCRDVHAAIYTIGMAATFIPSVLIGGNVGMHTGCHKTSKYSILTYPISACSYFTILGATAGVGVALTWFVSVPVLATYGLYHGLHKKFESI